MINSDGNVVLYSYHGMLHLVFFELDYWIAFDIFIVGIGNLFMPKAIDIMRMKLSKPLPFVITI